MQAGRGTARSSRVGIKAAHAPAQGHCFPDGLREGRTAAWRPKPGQLQLLQLCAGTPAGWLQSRAGGRAEQQS